MERSKLLAGGVGMFWLLLLQPFMLAAELSVSPLVGENAVLQRDAEVPIWGGAAPGETVVVEFGEQHKETVADDEGRWEVRLDPMSASNEPRNLVVTGGGSETSIDLGNILVGEVWFASGQSNMAWTVQNSGQAEAELAAADYPGVRYFRVSFIPAEEPAADLEGEVWRVATPGTDHAGENPTMTRAFSAVAYYFARELNQKLGIPVGVVGSAHGGTQIESWMSRESIQASPWEENIRVAWQQRLEEYKIRSERYREALAEWEAEAARAEAGGEEPPAAPREPEVIPGGRHMPSGLYNGMVHPVLPLAIRGIIWYQGESNAGRHAAYAELFPRMIEDWRERFGQGTVPFYFVQLANFNVRRDSSEQSWAFLREAQTAALELEQTGMAVAIDIGDPDDVHPKNKQDVGKRLALIALANVYGMEVPFSGPRFSGLEVEGGALRVVFEDADGLELRDVEGKAFEVAGADRVFHPAEAVVEGETVLVHSEQVSEPVAVRYAWRNNPPAPLYNGAGLPASPFRSDDWD